LSFEKNEQFIDGRLGTPGTGRKEKKASKPQQLEYDTARLLPTLAIKIYLVDTAVRHFPMANAVRPERTLFHDLV